MLSPGHFYHNLTRKYVILFGNMFNDISLIRTDADDSSEIERFKVPLVYGPKERWLTRIRSEADLERQVQVILPRMSFELTGYMYDPGRKQQSLLRAAKANTDTKVAASYMGVPYDLTFDLNIYVRNIDDGTHIVEQILPYFNPDYTVSIDNLPEIGFIRDVPIILNSVQSVTEYEGNYDGIRFINWNLNFTVKAYYYGPITPTNIIRTSYTNIYNDPSLKLGNIIRLKTASGNGDFKIDGTVFQGTNYQTANAYGTVISWSNVTGNLTIAGTQGTWKVNNSIRSVDTNAVYTIQSFRDDALKLVEIKIEPDPITANANDDFGYTTTITEWPNEMDYS